MDEKLPEKLPKTRFRNFRRPKDEIYSYRQLDILLLQYIRQFCWIKTQFLRNSTIQSIYIQQAKPITFSLFPIKILNTWNYLLKDILLEINCFKAGKTSNFFHQKSFFTDVFFSLKGRIAQVHAKFRGGKVTLPMKTRIVIYCMVLQIAFRGYSNTIIRLKHLA